MKNAALYLVGNHDDKRDSRLREFAEEHGYKIIDGDFTDEKLDDRQGFHRLLQEAGDKGIEAVVVNGLGQLGPTLGLQIETMLKLSEAGIGILSFSEYIDSSEREGKDFLLRMIRGIERKLNPLPQSGQTGKKSRPGRKAVVCDVEEGVKMRLEQNLSYAEIGSKLGASKTTVHARIMRRILDRLKMLMGGQKSFGDHPAGEDGNGQGARQRGAPERAGG